jgi:hypothetical protein
MPRITVITRQTTDSFTFGPGTLAGSGFGSYAQWFTRPFGYSREVRALDTARS